MNAPWLCWVATEPIAVVSVPAGASAVMRYALPSPPSDVLAHAVPRAEVQATGTAWPDGPYWPTAMKPPELAISAVKAVSGPGEANGTSPQFAPPSTESTANGTTSPRTVA